PLAPSRAVMSMPASTNVFAAIVDEERQGPAAMVALFAIPQTLSLPATAPQTLPVATVAAPSEPVTSSPFQRKTWTSDAPPPLVHRPSMNRSPSVWAPVNDPAPLQPTFLFLNNQKPNALSPPLPAACFSMPKYKTWWPALSGAPAGT